MDGLIDVKWIDGWIYGYMEGLIDGWMDIFLYIWIDGWMERLLV